MDLSIVIVSYNVRHFLEQTLHSLSKASQNKNVEIWVVDNHSKDDSVAMVREKFPHVRLIVNHDNPGFSKANNQAIAQAQGKYILILNPDTVLQEDTIDVCYEYMERNPEAGALGVKMIDGQGKFLPESKRALPTPWVSFCKIFGLSWLFPRSRTFGQYHLGYLSDEEIHEIDILSGAFMWIRKDVLDKVGAFDERFFMYGEDVDLSYRIRLAGYKNIYLPTTSIIHYKGESTKRGSLNYVKMFYQAMILFVQKHFAGRQANVYSKAIHTAIYLRATLSIFKRAFFYLFPKLIDAALILIGLLYIISYWAHNIKNLDEYPYAVYIINLPLYILIWIISAFFNGAYDKPYKLLSYIKGIIIGTFCIAAVYAFLDNSLRFSRAIILLGATWAVVVGILWRMIHTYWRTGTWIHDGDTSLKRWLIVGNSTEVERTQEIMKYHLKEYTGSINPSKTPTGKELGHIDELEEVVRIFQIQEIIYCAADLPMQTIFQKMQGLQDRVQHKIIIPGSDSIIGSNSKNTAGDLYTTDISLKINLPHNIRNKRVLDIIVAIIAFILSPILYFIQVQNKNIWAAAYSVFLGKKTWVGYSTNEQSSILPPLRAAIIPNTQQSCTITLDIVKQAQMDFLYAKDYTTYNDLKIIWRNINRLAYS